MRKFILLFITVILSFTAFSQEISNKGKDFWVGYGYHQVMTAGNSQNMVLYFATEALTNVTVEIPGIGYLQTFTNIPANTIFTTPTMPKGAPDARLMTEGTLNKGIHVTSDQPIVAYAHIYNSSVSGACVLLPTTTLGKEYYSINYTNVSNSNNANSWFYVVAADTGTTTVEITPSANTIGGWVAGTTYTVSLTQGQIYNVMGVLLGGGGGTFTGVDLTGSKIKSIASGSNACKRIAVYSGSGRISVTCPNTNGSSSDNYMVQAFPKSAWGKRFLTATTGGNMTNNIYRVCVSDPAAVVQINGVVTTLPLQNNFYYEIPITNAPQKIEADLPITVAQYLSSQGTCGNPGPGDPEVIYLSPVEQSISDVLFNSNLLVAGSPSHHVNIIIPNGGTAISSFRLDGAVPLFPFTVHPQDPNYSYIKISGLTLGQHRLISDSGFNAIAYGFASAESYGYNAGTNVRDLNTKLEINNPNTDPSETEPSACTGSPFKFKVYFADSTTSLTAIRYDSIKWEVLTTPGNFIPNNFPVTIRPLPPAPPNMVEPDSVNIRNGKNVAWYSLPTFYTVTVAGTYRVKITLYRTSTEGCGNAVEHEFDLIVSDPPTASFTAPAPGCYLEPVVATETTPQIPKATYKWYWEFIDPVVPSTTIYTTRNATHTFTTPGVKTIRHASITTPGCLSDTIVHTVDLPKVPDGSIAGTTSVCTNAANPNVTVTMIDGRAPYRFTYTINGVAQPQIVSPTATYNLSVPTGTPGTYVYELTEVRNDGSTVCVRPITGQTATVIVRPLPNAAIAGATTVCLNSAPDPVVTFTGSNATAPYTFAYTINGVAQTPIVSNAAGVATVNAPTNTVGTFIYEITQVTDASSNTCSRNITATTTTVVVQDLPNAVIAGSTTAVCLNAAQPTVTFTGSVGTAPYTFNYTINGVVQTPVVSNAAGVATLNVPTTTAGTFIYEITQVQEGSTQTCLRAITGQTVTVTVNPLPNAAIAGAVSVCLNAAQPVVTFTGSNATAPYTFAYTINGVPQTPIVSDITGVATINAPTNVVGTFVYAITQVTDASSTTCSRAISGVSTTINVQDLPNAVIASSTTAVCLNSTPLPTITFTGNTGTAPYTFNYTINTVAQTPVVSNAAGVATITVPTNVATTYTYELTGVTEASAQTCARVITGQTSVVVVNPLPTATIAGATAVCKDGPQPTVTFTGADATAPYTFNYTINGVAQTPLVSNAAGVATILAPTNVAGTFTYQLTSVTDASSTLCSQLQNGSTVITINQLPAAAFTYTIPSCANNTITFTNTTTPNAAGVSTWAWDFGDPGSGGANSSNAFSPTHTFVLPGSYTVKLNAINSNGCVSNPDAIQNVIINDTPRAGFIVPEVCINDVATVFTDTSSINAPSTVNRPLNEWNYGDPPSGPLNNSIGINGSHLYSAPGVYTVRQIVTSNTGCRDTLYQDITINSADPVSNFTVNNSGGLCSSDSVGIVNLSTVGFGNVTWIKIYWDFVNNPTIYDSIGTPVFNGIYKHKYPTSTTNQNYTIRMAAHSGNICFTVFNRIITVLATPKVQFNNIPNTCLLVPPFQITQGSEIGGVPGVGTYSGTGITNPNGTFDPQIAGVGTHTIKYTFTASNAGACIDTLSKTITVLDTAHATFSYVTPTCQGVPVSFTDLSTSPTGVVLANTVWDFGDASPLESHAPGSTFTHLFPGVTSYTVTMHNVSAVGCLSKDTSAVITIKPNHVITLVGTNNVQTVCINRPIANISYTLSGGANNATVSGLPAGVTASVTGTTLTIQGSPTTTVGSPFGFTITTTGNDCIVANASGSITVNPDHTITLSSANANQSVCVNTAINDITYTLGGGAAGATITGLPPGVTYSVAGSTLTISGTPTSTTGSPFNFSINTTGNTCLVANALGSIKVNPYPVPTFAPDKAAYCIPVAYVKFNNGSTMPDGTGMTYLWNFDDPASGTLNSATAFSPTHFYASMGTYNVNLTATSTAVLNGGVIGCSKDITIPLTTIHPQPKAAYNTNKPSVCIADDVVFTDASDPKDGTTVSWHWDMMGDGSAIRTTNPVNYTYTATGDFAPSLYIVNSFGCHSDTLAKPFTVHPYPVVNAGVDRTILEFGSVKLDPTVTGNDLEYLWTPNLYFSNNNRVKQPTASLVKDDITYTLTVTARGGCAASDKVFVKVLKFPQIPNTFTPNGDGINDVWRIEYLDTYPNCRVQVFTRTGQQVFESKGYGTPWNGTKQGKELPFDTYYYIIEPGNGRDPITGYVTIVK